MCRHLFHHAVFVLMAVLTPSQGLAEQKPNVLFIVLDDLNDWTGFLGGHPQARTPNMDRLAQSGMLFTNAHCAAPSCNPSRAAVFTGIPPHQSGIYNNSQKLRDVLPDKVLLPRHFSDHGYWSAGSGKLLHYIIDPSSWDDYFPEKTKDYPFPRTYVPSKRPVSLPVAGAWQYVETDWAALDLSDEEYGGDWLVSRWIGEQLQRKHDKPSFLACGIYRPHEPWFVPRKYYEPFPLNSIQTGPGYEANDLEDVPTAGRQVARNRYFEHIQKEGQWKQAIQAYLASIYYADAMVGRVLDALEKSPARENTIVVLWSDHGWHLGEKEHWQKFTAWRLCTRVPLIIHVPPGCPGLPGGTKAGSVCDQSVSLTSLYRTLSELCGIPSLPQAQVPSLVPLLKAPQGDWPHSAITQLSHPESYSVSQAHWRYIHYENGDEELYHTADDPYEKINLLHSTPKEEHLRRATELRSHAPAKAVPVPAVPLASLPALPWYPAGADPSPPSQPDGNPLSITFVNHREEPVDMFWISPAGEAKPFGRLHPAKTQERKSRPGVVWEFRSLQGKPLGYFKVGDRQARGDIPDTLSPGR
ncbi:sulfatase-like hydrolase/transferase [Prosthecobacter sp. SYSU 5D2]|uniref:sulfatase-like hydrolase/transferase n=1 Tax=Prosthecobacter sp. SYSU 5D2 TaxID=3134134 RepID=UPI0031FEE976